MDYVSYRAFAKLDRCSENLVRRAVKEGRLPVGPEGGIDAALAGTGWRHGNVAKAAHLAANSAHTAAIEVLAGETVEDAAARVTDATQVIPAYAESLARKEFFIANLRQLEYDQKVGLVVLVSDVADVVGSQLATVRTKLLSIPSEQAPRIARLKTAVEVQDALLEALVDALSELTADRAEGSTA